MKHDRHGAAARRGQAGPARRDRAAKGRRPSRAKRHALTAFCVALALIMLGLSLYVGWWYVNRSRVRADADRYAQLYAGRESAAPTSVISPAPTVMAAPAPTAEITPSPTPEITLEPTPDITSAPTAAINPEPTPKITAAPTAEATPEPTPESTSAPTAEATLEPTRSIAPALTPVITAAPTPAASPAPTPEPATAVPTDTPVPFGADMPIVEDVPIPTPGSDTKVYALPTAPPVQAGFEALLALNPETVGFLDIEGMLALPVAQRENDNEYYLNHSFEGTELKEGSLFMDGLNRLVPEDDCLIVYGHNMKNDTMFGKLDAYGDVAYLRRHPVIHFDTLYENRSYVVFAAFTASMQPGNSRYFDVRKFIFDDVEFDKFVLKLQSRSVYKVPVDVQYGDRLLLLVTCDYTNREGRFILALRQLREGETEGDAWALAMQAAAK